MIDSTKLVEHSERLTSLFKGAWPSFHDAEIIAIDLWRGDICPERDRWIAPVVTVKIQVLEATQPGAIHAGNDISVTLRFHGADNISLIDFNHQNAINGLVFSHESSGDGVPPYIGVLFIRGHGADASFRCSRIEVIHAKQFLPEERYAFTASD